MFNIWARMMWGTLGLGVLNFDILVKHEPKTQPAHGPAESDARSLGCNRYDGNFWLIHLLRGQDGSISTVYDSQ